MLVVGLYSSASNMGVVVGGGVFFIVLLHVSSSTGKFSHLCFQVLGATSHHAMIPHLKSGFQVAEVKLSQGPNLTDHCTLVTSKSSTYRHLYLGCVRAGLLFNLPTADDSWFLLTSHFLFVRWDNIYIPLKCRFLLNSETDDWKLKVGTDAWDDKPSFIVVKHWQQSEVRISVWAWIQPSAQTEDSIASLQVITLSIIEPFHKTAYCLGTDLDLLK